MLAHTTYDKIHCDGIQLERNNVQIVQSLGKMQSFIAHIYGQVCTVLSSCLDKNLCIPADAVSMKAHHIAPKQLSDSRPFCLSSILLCNAEQTAEHVLW